MNRPRPVALFKPATFSQLVEFQCHICPFLRDHLLEVFLNWLLAMPRMPPVQHLDILLLNMDPRLSSSLVEKVLVRLAPTLTELCIVSEPQSEDDGLYLDYRVLDFAQFAILQMVTAGPVDWTNLRESFDAVVCLEHFVCHVLRAPTLRRLILRFAIGIEIEDAVENFVPDTLRWDSPDTFIMGSESLEEVSFVIYGYMMEPVQTYTVLDDLKACIFGLLPKADKRGVLRAEIDEETTVRMSQTEWDKYKQS
ncbi:hypothetical protein K525DRAFT_263766 [Schizophyllum commune Loenen D]|nr:hypothetical protein K525DRAFT_263766 [Schizophyllum commune Loenen D]